MKKFLLPAVLLLAVLLSVTVFASTDAEEAAPDYRSISIFGFNEQIGGAKLDTASPAAGSGCMRLDYSAGTTNYIISYVFPKAVDISDYDTVEFDLYLSDPAFFSMNIREGQLELTSSGKCDVEEVSWNWASIQNAIAGGPQQGWNRVSIRLPDKMALNKKKLNYFRFYTIDIKGPSKTITVKFDNLRAVKSSAPSLADIEAEMQPVAALVDAITDEKVTAQNYAALKEKVEEAKTAFRAMSLPAQDTFDTVKYNKLNRLNALIADYEAGGETQEPPKESQKPQETKPAGENEEKSGCGSSFAIIAILPLAIVCGAITRRRGASGGTK